jgi:carbon-monoxide dehydrogenase iron sulfur subunit
MKRIYALEAWCVNCHRCEIACKTAHSQSQDMVKAFLLENETAIPRIHVEGDNEHSIAVNCRHCDEPRCVEGCISGALQKDPQTGVVFCDQSKCVGCRTCMAMCPYGCIDVRVLPKSPRDKGIAFKCDLCGDGAGSVGEAACVAACPNRALLFIDSDED